MTTSARSPARRPQAWRLLLAALVLLLPFGVGVGRSIGDALHSPMQLERQKAGITLVQHLDAVLFDLQVLRVDAIALAVGDRSLAVRYGDDELKAIQTDLSTVDQDLAGQIGTVDTWTTVETVVHATVDGADKFHEAQCLTNFDDAIKKVYQFIDTITDVYHISLDPSTARSTQLLLLTGDEARRMGRVCELTAAAAAHKQPINSDDRTELVQLMTMMDHDEDAAETLYQKTLDENLNIGTRLDGGHKAFKAACDTFIDYAEKGIIENGGDSLTALHAKLAAALDFLTEFTQALGPCQVDLLTDKEKQHQQEAERYARQTVGLALEAGVVAFLLAFLLVR